VKLVPVLEQSDVEAVLRACRGAAEGRRPTIAVVDAAGHLLHLERPECNGVNTAEMATLKARTAAIRGRPSSDFGERVKDSPGFLMAPNSLGAPGGVPLFHEGICVGAVGISGADVDDEPIASAGAALFPGSAAR
jgi:uncharacterized protein GlcG (DUF336 family)